MRCLGYMVLLWVCNKNVQSTEVVCTTEIVEYGISDGYKVTL